MKRMLLMVIGTFLIVSGCREDERLVRMAQQSVETQRQQIEMIARQSQAVVAESAKLAETAKELVVKEAEARAEILAAQRDLQTQATVIEDERRELMSLRVREPVIAESLKLISGTLLCSLPLALVGLLLWPNEKASGEAAILNQLMLQELAGTSSFLLDKTPSKNLPAPTENALLPQPK